MMKYNRKKKKANWEKRFVVQNKNFSQGIAPQCRDYFISFKEMRGVENVRHNPL